MTIDAQRGEKQNLELPWSSELSGEWPLALLL
jgi:hypothetical protein